jgi:hypothetical protein
MPRPEVLGRPLLGLAASAAEAVTETTAANIKKMFATLAMPADMGWAGAICAAKAKER